MSCFMDTSCACVRSAFTSFGASSTLLFTWVKISPYPPFPLSLLWPNMLACGGGHQMASLERERERRLMAKLLCTWDGEWGRRRRRWWCRSRPPPPPVHHPSASLLLRPPCGLNLGRRVSVCVCISYTIEWKGKSRLITLVHCHHFSLLCLALVDIAIESNHCGVHFRAQSRLFVDVTDDKTRNKGQNGATSIIMIYGLQPY